MEIIYSSLLKLLIVAKPWAPGFMGAVLNALIRHYLVVVKGATRTDWTMKLMSLCAAVMIGAGFVYLVEALYAFKKLPPDPLVFRAAFFVGATGGLELILWLIGHANTIVNSWERHIIKSATNIIKGADKDDKLTKDSSDNSKQG